MTKRFWHGLNKETNPLGIGCWQIAGTHSIDGRPNGWGPVNEKDAVGILANAMKSGIDFYDTAQAYNNGKSEEILGKAIRQASAEVVICSKIVLSDEEVKNQSPAKDFPDRVEQSLKRLGTGRLDILLIHNPPDRVNWQEFDNTIFTDLVRKGKIGTYGVSTRGLNAAKNVVEANFGTVVEWVFNIFERRPAAQLFPLTEQNKFNFIARSPLSRGLINPKYLSLPPEFDKDDFRSTLPKEWMEWTIDALKKFHANGVAPEELTEQAIRYCLQYKAVTSAIVGIRTAAQLSELLKINASLHAGGHIKRNYLEGISECFPKWA